HWDSTLNVYTVPSDGSPPIPAVKPVDDPRNPERRVSFRSALHTATSETVGHIGALVIRMALSVSVGGFLERIENMEAFPTYISS
ncbi:hypothetical protein ACG9WS_19985, partial [Acinetobacter geminorum]